MARRPLTVADCVELAVVERSGFEESRHLGAGVVVDVDGEILHRVGDPAASIFPRSTLKPFQALAVRRAGAVFRGSHLVLSAASHNGSARHTTAVAGMLAAYGNSPDDLRCPADLPGDRAALLAATAPSRLAMTCSGKHAAMLAACRVNGWDVESYLDPDHPLQRLVAAEIEAFTGERLDAPGADGCGTPVFALTLHGLARGIAGLVSAEDPAAREFVEAVLADPWAIDGDGGVNTVTIAELGVVAKLGAEGIMVIGVPGSGAVAVKVLDGNLRAANLAALTLLADAGLLDRDRAVAVAELTVPPVLSTGRRVGAIRPGAGLAPARDDGANREATPD